MLHFVCPCIHPWTLGLLPPLALMNNAAMNAGVQISLSPWVQFFWIPTQKWTGWIIYNSICNFLRNHHTVFHNGYAISYSQEQCTRVPVSPYSHQYLLFSSFLIVAILTGMRCYLSNFKNYYSRLYPCQSRVTII